MKKFLEKDERIDDLEYKGLKIIQNTNGFCFGIDSILLSDFAKGIKSGSKVLDLGTGTGIISILLCGKTDLKEIIGIEIQKEVAEMAQRSIGLNNLNNRFSIMNEDIRQLSKIFPANSIDAIVTNPPYKKEKTGLENENINKNISKHEIMCNIEDIAKISKYLLKNNCSLYLVHRPDRLVDIIESLRNNNLEPKQIKFVFPKINKEPNLVLIKATKNAKSFLKIEKPLIVYDEMGKYTNDILNIYNKKKE